MSDPVVTLIFPPLVETSFGAIYPSTAQLTGYLQMHDLPCRQLDLNGDFADYLEPGPVGDEWVRATSRPSATISPPRARGG